MGATYHKVRTLENPKHRALKLMLMILLMLLIPHFGGEMSRSRSMSRSAADHVPQGQPQFSPCTRGDSIPFLSVTLFDLRHGDCLTGMRQLDDATVDLVVTSPPYNLGIAYGSYSDRQDHAIYLDWCQEWAAEIRRVLKPAGSLFLNLGASPSNPLVPHELVVRLRNLFVLQNTIHWIKAITIEDKEGVPVSSGHFKPINSPRYLNDCHEYVFHLTPDGTTPIDRLALGVPYQDKSNIARWSHTRGTDLRCRGNTWFVPYQTIRDRDKQRPHPATFPIELAENCIRLHGVDCARLMLDLFLGIGNSALAAQRCDVERFIGFEIDEAYLTEAKRRIAERSS